MVSQEDKSDWSKFGWKVWPRFSKYRLLLSHVGAFHDAKSRIDGRKISRIDGRIDGKKTSRIDGRKISRIDGRKKGRIGGRRKASSKGFDCDRSFKKQLQL